MGCGAVVTANLIADRNIDLFVCLALSGLAGGVVALVVGLPALRVSGQFLAVTTLAFAVAMELYFLNPANYEQWLPAAYARPELWGALDLSNERWLYALALALLVGRHLHRPEPQGAAPGRSISATRDNERGRGRGRHQHHRDPAGRLHLRGHAGGRGRGPARRLPGRHRAVDLPGVDEPAGVLDGRHRRRLVDRGHPGRRRPRPVGGLRVPEGAAAAHRRRPPRHPARHPRWPRPGLRDVARPLRPRRGPPPRARRARRRRDRRATGRPGRTAPSHRDAAGAGAHGRQRAPRAAGRQPAHVRGRRGVLRLAPGAVRRRRGRRAQRAAGPARHQRRRQVDASSRRSPGCCLPARARSRSTGATSPTCRPRRSPGWGSR